MTEGDKQFIRSLVQLSLDNRKRERITTDISLRHWFNGRAEGFLLAAKYFYWRVKFKIQ